MIDWLFGNTQPQQIPVGIPEHGWVLGICGIDDELKEKFAKECLMLNGRNIDGENGMDIINKTYEKDGGDDPSKEKMRKKWRVANMVQKLKLCNDMVSASTLCVPVDPFTSVNWLGGTKVCDAFIYLIEWRDVAPVITYEGESGDKEERYVECISECADITEHIRTFTNTSGFCAVDMQQDGKRKPIYFVFARNDTTVEGTIVGDTVVGDTVVRGTVVEDTVADDTIVADVVVDDAEKVEDVVVDDAEKVEDVVVDDAEKVEDVVVDDAEKVEDMVVDDAEKVEDVVVDDAE